MTDPELMRLYNLSSKHSQYQVVPDALTELLGSVSPVAQRFERERWAAIRDHVVIAGQTVLDVGGNSGFFTFAALEAGASKVTYVEGNADHANLVRRAAHVLELEDRILVLNRYLDFVGMASSEHDVLLLLNVVHHLGDDYLDAAGPEVSVLAEIGAQLRAAADWSATMVFQMGFNHGGDVGRPLFRGGTKQEMIQFVEGAVRGSWSVDAVLVPERVDGRVEHRPLSASNVNRDDSLGEFLNRPLFVLRSVV